MGRAACRRGTYTSSSLDEFNAQELHGNVTLNGLTSVTHYAIAASNAEGKASFGLGGSKGDGIHSLVIGSEHKRVVEVPDDTAGRGRPNPWAWLRPVC